MVEGHQCHRVAAAHRKLLVGKRFVARSPNGRFTQGAEAVNGKMLARIEVIGKNMFYFFRGDTAQVAPRTRKPAKAIPRCETAPILPLSALSRGAKHGQGASKWNGKAGSTQQQQEVEEEEVKVEEDGSPQEGTRNEVDQAESGRQQSQQLQAEGVAAAAAVKGAGGSSRGGDAEPVVVRIHFGMSGTFKVSASLPGPAPTPTTRLSLTNSEHGLVAMLSAMTVEMGGVSLFKEWEAKLGPDPLREDADAERLWAAMQSSRKPVGLALMTQEMVAGLGNIYRAEVLFKAGVHPEQPCRTVSRPTFDRLWHHSVALLQRGFSTGSIITVDPEEAAMLGKPWTRRYIYNQRQCGRCKGTVRTWDMAARTVYCCETCQPLITDAAAQAAPANAATETAGGLGKREQEDASASCFVTPQPKRPRPDAAEPSGTIAATPKGKKPRARKAKAEEGSRKKEETKPAAVALLSPARLAAMQAAVPTKVFNSHCAPDDAEEMQAKMAYAAGEGQAAMAGSKHTVAELKEKLRMRGLSTTGTKAALLERLAAAGVLTGSAPAAPPPELPAGGAKVRAAAAVRVRARAGPGPGSPAAGMDQSSSRRRGYQAAGTRAGAALEEDGEDEVDRAERLLADQLGVPGADAETATTASRQQVKRPKRGDEKEAGTKGPPQEVPVVVPGTQGLPMASPEEAAREKAEAGENRAVEHVPF